MKKVSSKKADKAGRKEVPPLDPDGNNLITGDVSKGDSGPMKPENRDGEWGGGYVAVRDKRMETCTRWNYGSSRVWTY